MEGHSHFSGCGCAGFEFSPEEDNLIDVIDKDNITCFNENKKNTCKAIFREEPDKKKFSLELESPKNDPEFLQVIPFTEEVKIRAINLICQGADKRPNQIGLFTNIENFDWDLTEEEPMQTLPLNNWTDDWQTEELTNINKFVRVHKLIQHFKNDDAKQIGLVYCGIRGIRTKAKRGVVHTNYEAIANLEDHKKELEMLNKDANQNTFGL